MKTIIPVTKTIFLIALGIACSIPALAVDTRPTLQGLQLQIDNLQSSLVSSVLKQIGTVELSDITQQPAPLFAAGIHYDNPYSPSSGGGAGAAKTTFQPFILTKQVDTASPKIFLHTLESRVISQVSINIFVPGGTAILAIYQLLDAFPSSSTVKSVQNGNQTILVEEISFSYRKIKQTVFTKTTPVETCFDLSRNSAC